MMRKRMCVTLSVLAFGVLAGASVVSSHNASSIAYVSDAEGAKLFGGGCGIASTQNYPVCEDSTKMGCTRTLGDNTPSGDGSWQFDKNKNCGVKECGTVPVNKMCSS